MVTAQQFILSQLKRTEVENKLQTKQQELLKLLLMLNSYKDVLPNEFDDELLKRYQDLFKLLLKYEDDVERVSFDVQ